MDTLKKIRAIIVFYMFALVAAGITAFPVQWELETLFAFCGIDSSSLVEMEGEALQPVISWLYGVKVGLTETNDKYPYLAYGYDWLAFAHIVIALLFVGPLRDPVKNKWIIYWAMCACVAIFPLAFICGPIRQIPFVWTLIDCSFGFFGIMPLILCARLIRQYEVELGIKE